MTHLKLGMEGEAIAAEFLEKLGYQIRERNWRYRKLEVDLIADDGEDLVFVEVKLRSEDDYGLPRDFVGIGKQRNLIRAADAYVNEQEIDRESRFDIIGISMGNSMEIEHIKDAFTT